MLKIALVGANGKMGVQITQLIKAKPDLYSLAIAIINNPSKINPDVKQTAKAVSDDQTQIQDVDVVIDFSTPQSSLNILKQCLLKKIPLVLGTTGFSQSESKAITDASKTIPILMSPNFSLSVNMLFKLSELAAARLRNFETEIIEAHHHFKKDAPSGTAMKLGEVVATARNIDFSQHAKYSRHGIDEVRHPDDIGFAVVRGGDIVGKHDVMFINDGEILTLSSEINNRDSFASGALVASAFLAVQKPQLYSMFDVLGL